MTSIENRIKAIKNQLPTNEEIWLLVCYGKQPPHERFSVGQPVKHEYFNPETRAWQDTPYFGNTVIEPDNDEPWNMSTVSN
jgi:hypothetical protein